jgi:hypothetical protein
MQMNTDIAPTVTSHLDQVYIRMCALVSKTWSRIFSSRKIWRNLCNRTFTGATSLIANTQDPTTDICWRREYFRLASLLRFNEPARPEIDPGLLEAVLEITFDRVKCKKPLVVPWQTPKEWKDPLVLRVHGLSLIDEESGVQPRHQACVLRGEVDSIDSVVLEQLKASSEKCMLRTFLQNRANVKVALLHIDEPDSELGVALSKDEVSFPILPAPSSLLLMPLCRCLLRSDVMNPLFGARQLLSFESESHSMLEHEWMYHWSAPAHPCPAMNLLELDH